MARHAPLTAVVAMSLVPAASAQINVAVTVDPANPGTVVPDLGIGLHTSVYANHFDNPALPGLIADSGVQLLRYPGGSYSDFYQWSTHDTHGGYVADGSDFANFVHVLDASGTAGMVTVNYGSSFLGSLGGQPQEAAAWVAYANADASVYATSADVPLGTDGEGTSWNTAGYWARLRSSTVDEYRQWARADGVYDRANDFLAIGRTEPVGIRQWEIGNEINGNGYYDVQWETDLHADHSPQAYGENVRAFAAAMKAVDPDIEVGAVFTASGIGDTSDPATNWDTNVLQSAGDAIDFGVYHFYTDNGDGNQRDRRLLASVDGQLRDDLALLRQRIETSGLDVPIHMTEFGFFGSTSHPSVNAFFDTDVYLTAMEQGVQSVHFLELSKDGFLGDCNPEPGEAYYAIQMVDLVTDPGDVFLPAVSDNDAVKVHAVRKKDGSIALLILNPTPGDGVNDAIVTLDLGDLQLTGDGVLYEYGYDQVDAGVGPTERLLTGLDGTLTLRLPDASMTALLLSVSVPEPAVGMLMLTTFGLLARRRRVHT